MVQYRRDPCPTLTGHMDSDAQPHASLHPTTRAGPPPAARGRGVRTATTARLQDAHTQIAGTWNRSVIWLRDTSPVTRGLVGVAGERLRRPPHPQLCGRLLPARISGSANPQPLDLCPAQHRDTDLDAPTPPRYASGLGWPAQDRERQSVVQVPASDRAGRLVACLRSTRPVYMHRWEVKERERRYAQREPEAPRSA